MDSKNQKVEIDDRIELALNAIRPYLEADGGDVRFLEIDSNMIVKLELLGSCVTCPMSSMTMKAGVEEAIKRAVPEINGVVAVNIDI
ncbi:NifU family protein [Bacteroidota bacterium]